MGSLAFLTMAFGRREGTSSSGVRGVGGEEMSGEDRNEPEEAGCCSVLVLVESWRIAVVAATLVVALTADDTAAAAAAATAAAAAAVPFGACVGWLFNMERRSIE
jgi:hypothetical protein